MLKRLLTSLLLATIGLLFLITPAFAIANPDTIAFSSAGEGKYKAFYDVYEAGDMLFVADSCILEILLKEAVIVSIWPLSH